jgi:hypothetical protein
MADMVRFELGLALERRVPIIPLLVAKAGMPAAGELPPSLRKLPDQQGMEIRPAMRDFESDMARLIRTLQELGIPSLESDAR